MSSFKYCLGLPKKIRCHILLSHLYSNFSCESQGADRKHTNTEVMLCVWPLLNKWHPVVSRLPSTVREEKGAETDKELLHSLCNDLDSCRVEAALEEKGERGACCISPACTQRWAIKSYLRKEGGGQRLIEGLFQKGRLLSTEPATSSGEWLRLWEVRAKSRAAFACSASSLSGKSIGFVAVAAIAIFFWHENPVLQTFQSYEDPELSKFLQVFTTRRRAKPSRFMNCRAGCKVLSLSKSADSHC